MRIKCQNLSFILSKNEWMLLSLEIIDTRHGLTIAEIFSGSLPAWAHHNGRTFRTSSFDFFNLHRKSLKRIFSKCLIRSFLSATEPAYVLLELQALKWTASTALRFPWKTILTMCVTMVKLDFVYNLSFLTCWSVLIWIAATNISLCILFANANCLGKKRRDTIDSRRWGQNNDRVFFLF